MHPKTYEINNKTYTQRPLVLGQVMPLIDLLQDIELSEFSALGIIRGLGPSLPEVMAIILIPEGVRLRDRNLAALAEEFEEYLTIETALAVAEDFLSFNPLSSISARMTGVMVNMIAAAMKVIQSRQASGELSRTSAVETLPDKAESSGLSPSPTP